VAKKFLAFYVSQRSIILFTRLHRSKLRFHDGELLLVPLTIFKMEYQPLPFVRCSLFDIFSSALHRIYLASVISIYGVLTRLAFVTNGPNIIQPFKVQWLLYLPPVL